MSRKITTEILIMGVHRAGFFESDAPDDLAGGWEQFVSLGALAYALDHGGMLSGVNLVKLVEQYGASALSFRVRIEPLAGRESSDSRLKSHLMRLPSSDQPRDDSRS